MVVIAAEHLEDLRDPEEPDPRRHLLEVIFHLLSNLAELGDVEVSPLLDEVDDVRHDEAALVQTEGDRAEIAFKHVLERDFVFFEAEDRLIQLGKAQPGFRLLLIKGNGFLQIFGSALGE